MEDPVKKSRVALTPARILSLVAVLIHAALVIWAKPFKFLRGYAWKPLWKVQPGALLLVPLAIVSWLIVREALDARRRLAWRVGATYLLSTVLQLGFALADGRGIVGVRAKLQFGGHSTFADAGLSLPGLFHMMRHYEDLVRDGSLGLFAPSKPPGTMAFYMMWIPLAEALHMPEGSGERLIFFESVLAAVWSFIPALTVLPLFGLARRLLDDERAIVACVLLSLTPSMILVTMHTDQVIYPLLTVTSLWLTAEGYARKSHVICALAGASMYVAVFFSFGLLPVIPLAAAVVVTLALRESPETTWRGLFSARFARAPILALAVTFVGFAVADVGARLALHYDILFRYRASMAYHMTWKNFTLTPDKIVYYAALNPFEYLIWFGPAAAALLLFDWKHALADTRAGKLTPEILVALAPLLVIVLLCLFGRTAGEVARLWIFLMPSCAMVVAAGLARVPEGERRPLLSQLLALQLFTTSIDKLFQDFR